MADITDVLASLLGGGLGGFPSNSGGSPIGLPSLPAAGQSPIGLPNLPSGVGGSPIGLPTLPGFGVGSPIDLPTANAKALTMVGRAATALAADRAAQQPGAQAGQLANRVAPASVPAEYRGPIQEAAAKYGVDPALLAAQLKQESMNFNPDVVAGRRLSPAGAAGVAQFMPATARQYNVDVNDPASSIEGMAHYMSDLLRQYNGDQRAALAAYNGGDRAVQRLRQGTPFQETQQYLAAVQRNLDLDRAVSAEISANAIEQRANTGNPAGQAFLASAMQLQGVPYVWGGTSAAGVDCSGLIIVAARESGHPLAGRPTAQGIYNQVQRVDASAVQPGDLVFFEGTSGANAGERISHVGIVTQQGMMLNAPEPGKNVMVAPYTSPYWAPKIVGYGRLP